MAVRSIEHRTKVPEIRKGDTVVVLAGRDAGKRGKVEHVIRRDAVADARALRLPPHVAQGRRVRGRRGLNIARKHTKPRQRSSGGMGSMPTIDPGGILDHAMPLPASRVMIVCGHCDRPTRVAPPRRSTTARACACASTAASRWRCSRERAAARSGT